MNVRDRDGSLGKKDGEGSTSRTRVWSCRQDSQHARGSGANDPISHDWQALCKTESYINAHVWNLEK